MAVYVDDASIPAEVRNGPRVHNSRWSHLTADTADELHAFAQRLGLRREWFQDGRHPHYDVTEGKRHRALQLGAQPNTWREAEERSRAMHDQPQAAASAAVQKYLLFTSSRDGITEDDVEAALRPLFAPDKILVSGAARGGDQIAARLWRQWGGQVDEHPVRPVEWQRSRGAGQRRNAEMVAKVQAAVGAECLAVIARCTATECPRTEPHGTHGAVHCAGLAEDAGLPVHRIKAAVADQPRTAAKPATRRHSRYYPPDMALPEGICPGCRSAALTSGRTSCQACGLVAAMPPARAQAYPDLSHGHRGHMCVLPGANADQPEAEAGS
jgi:hypothetical protein